MPIKHNQASLHVTLRFATILQHIGIKKLPELEPYRNEACDKNLP